jgi:hypothetical protein
MALSPVVGGGLVHNKRVVALRVWGHTKIHQTHYWALRQQARRLFVPLWETGGDRRRGNPGWRVVAPSFGGGVWCLICG